MHLLLLALTAFVTAAPIPAPKHQAKHAIQSVIRNHVTQKSQAQLKAARTKAWQNLMSKIRRYPSDTGTEIRHMLEVKLRRYQLQYDLPHLEQAIKYLTTDDLQTAIKEGQKIANALRGRVAFSGLGDLNF